MKIISDKDTIKSRSGLQVMRDNLLWEAGFFIDELRENIQLRKQRKVPLITKGDVDTFGPILLEIASIQSELITGDPKIWQAKPQGEKERIAKVPEELILKEMASGNPTDTTDLLEIIVPLINQELKK